MIHDKVLKHSQSAADLGGREDDDACTPPCTSSSMTCVCHALNPSCTLLCHTRLTWGIVSRGGGASEVMRRLCLTSSRKSAIMSINCW